MIGKLTRTVVRTFAFALTLCATTSAWGEMRPAVAWFGDFSSTQHANRNVTYTLSNISNGDAQSNNTVQGDADNGYYVQMNGSSGLKVKSNAATFGFTSNGKSGFTALMLYSDYAAADDASTRDLLIGFHDNGATPSKEQIGVANYRNKAQGIWDNCYYETSSATKSPTDSTVFPTSATEAKTAVAFKFLRNSSMGAFYVKQSSGTPSSGEFGGLTSDINISGVSFGGPNFTANATKPLSMARGMKIHGIIMFHSLLTDAELSAWSLTGMTTMQKLTSSQELTSVGSSTALNLEANGGTFTVASDITAAAVFVQDYEQTITFTSGKITAPFYAGSAVTIDASNYDVSSMEDGDTIQLINGPVCGIELNDIVVPESTASLVYYPSKDSNGIYLNAAANYDWKYVNINFYHNDDSKITTSAAIGLEGVAGTSWNNVPGTLGSHTGIVVLDGESHSFKDARIVVAISGIQGSYHDTNYAANSDLRRGFIHDHNTSYRTPTVTISNVPFDEYRVIVYHSTDSNNGSTYAHFGYDTVNGINLTYGSGKLGIGDTQWGDTNDSSRSQPIAEGVNALVSGVYTNKTLTIVSHRMEGDTTRAGIAAIQIIKASVPTDDVAISITKPSSDWDSLTLPTTAKLYGICAASGSAAEESFGNNSTYLQTLGERSATVVVITNGVYTGINGLLKAGETISETRDSYVIMKGGTATIVKGRQVAPHGGTTTKNTTGNSFVQLEGDAVVGYVFGVGDQGGNSPTLTGLSGVTVKGDSIVLGSVIGGWSSSHKATPKVTAGTAVRIQNLQTKNYRPTLSVNSVIPDNCIIGGSIVQWNYGSHSQIDGDSSVKIDIESGTGDFSKRIIGASCIPDQDDKYGDNTVKGNSSVSISAPTTINFPYFIVGGGYNGYTGASSSSANVERNSSVTLNSGTFSGTIVAGGYTADGVSGSANVQGIAKLIVNGGSFSSATLAGGNATQGKMLVANTAIDTSSVTVKGFDALEVGADVTQAAITQTSGEFTEITVHDGAQYTAATTGSSDLRVVSSTDGGTKGVVVFDGLASTYSGDITITSGSKAKLVSGTYTGTFTVETGASLEIDPGAGSTYACAASFAGAGDVIVKSGTVSFSGSNTLTKGIQVDDGAVVTATTGSEGKISVLNGGTLKLTVASNNEIWYDGYVAADVTTTGTGAVEYYDVGGTKIVDGVYPDPNTREATTGHFNGLNLLPYYYVWDPTRDTSGSMSLSNTDLWRAGILPGDGTNVAIYVSGETTIDVDVDKFFGEVQVYGSGSPDDSLTISGTETITTAKLNVGAETYINGQSVDATDTIRNNVSMAITGTFECNAAIVGSGDVYVGDSATTSATETDVTFKKKNTGMSGDLYVMNKAVAKTTKTDGEEGTGFGPYGGSITVCTGGQIDLANTSGVCYDITIEQGVSSETPAIVNTGDAMTGNHRQTTSLTVNANATIRCDSSHGWGLVGSSRGATSLTFKKGVTLTKVGGGNFYMCSSTVSNTGTGDAPKFVIAEGALETVSAGDATENVLADGASLEIIINSGATFNGNKSIAASTFTVDGTANIGSSATLTATSLVVNKTVNVASTGVISATAVSGGGTVNWTGRQPNSNVWKNSGDWTGTNVVMCAGTGRITNLVPENWGRNGSYIVMKNLKGYIDTDDTTIQAKVIFEDGDNGYALALDDGYGGRKSYFREIAGSGTIKDVNERTDGGASQLFIFRKAVDYTGSIINLGTPGKNFTKQFFFSAEDTNPDGSTVGRIVVESDGEAVIGDGNKWDTQYGTTLQGTLALKGVATLEKRVTISGSSARINLAGTALTINSTLTATDATWTIGGTLPGAPTRSTPVTLITGLTAEPTLGTVTIAGLSDQYTVYAVEDSGTYSVVVRLKNDEWNSASATEWTTTSFNGSSDYSDGINVYFGAIDAVVAKTVTISGTVSPANVTFRAGASTTYTLTGGTFSPSGTVAVESGTVVIESEMTAGAITVADGATLSLTNATVASINSGVSPAVGTLNIPAGGVVTITSSSALDGIKYLTGEGTLVVGANIPSAALRALLTKVNENDSSTHYWKGTLSFVGLTSNPDTNNFQFELFGTADSKIKLTNCAISYLKDNNATFDGCLILNDDESHNGALRIGNGYSSNSNDFGELAGNGNMVFTGGPLQLYRFHTAPNYTGSISIAGSWDNNNTKYDGRRIVFGTSPATVDNYSKPASITVDAGVEAGLGEGATWNAAYGIYISGTIIVNGDATLMSDKTLDHESSDPINLRGDKHIVFYDGAKLLYKKLCTVTTAGDVTLAEGSTVAIAFADGVSPVDGTKLISWSAAPAGTFVFEAGEQAKSFNDEYYQFLKKDDGLYVYKSIAWVGDKYYLSVSDALAHAGATANVWILASPSTETVALGAGQTMTAKPGVSLENLTVNAPSDEYVSPISPVNSTYSVAPAATEYTWSATGEGVKNWTDPANWTYGSGTLATRCPTDIDSVVFNDGASVYMTGTKSVNGIEINGSVTIAGGGELKTSGNVTAGDSGSLTLNDVCLTSLSSGITVAPAVNFTNDSEIAGDYPLTINGNVTISGSFRAWGGTGVEHHDITGDVTINSGASFSSGNVWVFVNGDATVKGSFTSGNSKFKFCRRLTIEAGRVTANGSNVNVDSDAISVVLAGLSAEFADTRGQKIDDSKVSTTVPHGAVKKTGNIYSVSRCGTIFSVY